MRDLVGLDELAHRLHGLGPLEPTVGRAFVARWVMSSAGVSIQPGLSMFTRTRWRMSVKAMLRVAATSAIFDAEYGKRLGAPPWRATEPISTIEPSTVLPHHELGRLLGDEAGGADVEGHHLVPHGGRGIPHRPAKGRCCAVDRGMQRPERLIGGSHAAFRTVRSARSTDTNTARQPSPLSDARPLHPSPIATDEQQAARTLF